MTLSLIGFSYIGRYGSVILVITLIIDNSDIWIGLTRAVVDIVRKEITIVCSVILLASWVYFRLYLMLLEVCYGAGWGLFKHTDDSLTYPHIYLSMFLYLLMGMNVWWFYLLILMFI
jgi:TLC domain